MPCLRERREDILPLALHYLRFFEGRQGRQHLAFSHRCEDAIVQYSWPGNLRELRNSVERAVILSLASIIELTDLGLDANRDEAGGENSSVTEADAQRARVATPVLGGDCSIADIEREHIARVVAHSPSFESAAQMLGIDPTTLQRKRKRYGLA